MHISYDLKAPDFSYLMIAEIKDYYHSKHNTLNTCRSMAAQITFQVEQYTEQFTSQAQIICNIIDSLETSNINSLMPDLIIYASELRSLSTYASTMSPNIYEAMHRVSTQPTTTINLHGYQKIPPLHQVTIRQPHHLFL
jgi:hypothetical protein